MLYGKKTKTRKRRKPAESFVKLRSPVANIWNFQVTLKKQPIWYVNTSFTSRTDETTFKLHYKVYIDNFE